MSLIFRQFEKSSPPHPAAQILGSFAATMNVHTQLRPSQHILKLHSDGYEKNKTSFIVKHWLKYRRIYTRLWVVNYILHIYPGHSQIGPYIANNICKSRKVFKLSLGLMHGRSPEPGKENYLLRRRYDTNDFFVEIDTFKEAASIVSIFE